MFRPVLLTISTSNPDRLATSLVAQAGPPSTHAPAHYSRHPRPCGSRVQHWGRPCRGCPPRRTRQLLESGFPIPPEPASRAENQRARSSAAGPVRPALSNVAIARSTSAANLGRPRPCNPACTRIRLASCAEALARTWPEKKPTPDKYQDRPSSRLLGSPPSTALTPPDCPFAAYADASNAAQPVHPAMAAAKSVKPVKS